MIFANEPNATSNPDYSVDNADIGHGDEYGDTVDRRAELEDQRIIPAPTGPSFRVWPSTPPDDLPFEISTELSDIGFTGRNRAYTTADTFYPSWGADDRLYTPLTDGSVDGVYYRSDGANPVIGHAIIEGDDPLGLTVIEPGVVPGDPRPYHGRYPAGSLMYDGVWYIGTYALTTAEYGTVLEYNWPVLGPFVGFHTSEDLGKTWQVSPLSAEPGKALFPEPAEFKGPVKIGAPKFVDFGKNMEHSPDGKAYLVGHGSTQQDGEERTANLSWITGDEIYLSRVRPSIETINDESHYEYFGGHDENGEPIWTGNFSEIKPLLEWNNNMGCVTMTYNAPLGKYLMVVTDGGNTMSKFNTYILEADKITGPWRLVTYMRDFGQQAYFVNFPSKFISDDGKTAWLCYSANFTNNFTASGWLPIPPGSRYAMSLQEVKLLGPDDKRPNNPLMAQNNIAYFARISTSSTHPDYTADALVDGVVDGYPNAPGNEWVSDGEQATAMIRLAWDEPQTIDQVWLFDRPNSLDQVRSGMVVFSDASMINFDELPDDARSGLELTFAPKEVEWMVVLLSEVKDSTANIGLSELAVFRADVGEPESR